MSALIESASFDGFAWSRLRAAIALSRIANKEFEVRKLTRDLTSLSAKSLGTLMESEAKDEVNFREALQVIGWTDTDIELAVQEVLGDGANEAVNENEGEPF